ncbi:hypothetical protein V6N13_104294 [Hibiscus sabdariffa]|uniref:Uncharacterized protein n=1 Tax=Hibiscus sabdariffa TaxID=183260 RepID=A0ABR2DL41_9ROSI
MGATGTGKSRLAIDLSTREIVNSDKMQISNAMLRLLLSAKDHLPIVAGGINSYVEALVNDDPEQFLYETWERLVAGPSTMIVEQFLYEKNRVPTIFPSASSSSVPTAAVAAASR